MKKKIWILALVLLSGNVFAQGKYGATAEDSVACITAISLYKEHFKQKNYADAKSGWIQVFDICPQAQKSTYLNGVKMYRQFIKEATDDAVKQNLIDTLYMVYDRRIEYYKQEAYVLGRKGSDMAKYDEDLMPAYETMKKSVYMGKTTTEAGVFIKYYQTIYKLYADKKLDKSVLIEEYIPLAEMMDGAVFDVRASILEAKDDKTKEKLEKKLEQYISSRAKVDDIFIKIAQCDDIVPIIEQRVNANPEDLQTLRVASFLLSKRECTDSEIFAVVAKKLYDLEPSARSAYALGLLTSKREEYAESARYLSQAVDLCEDCPDKEKYLVKAAKAYYFQKQNKKSASLAKQALKLNPNNGEAYITLGMAIAGSAESCGGGTIEKASVYWLATDYFYKAKSVEPSVAEQANKYIGTYKKYFPGKEEVFFANLKEGDTYTVPCWGETTKVKIGGQ